MSFGKEQLLTSAQGDVAFAKNRRVEFRLMRGPIRLMLEDGDLLDDRGKPIGHATAPMPRG
jgi:hypothetical protein